MRSDLKNMRLKLVEYLSCPNCSTDLSLEVLVKEGEEILTGLLFCEKGHTFPITGGIPRMLPSSLAEYSHKILDSIPPEREPELEELIKKVKACSPDEDYDIGTRKNFSNEWDNHDIGGRTWAMELEDRVKWFFLDSIRIPEPELDGKMMLDAGCGNGSQSVAYTKFGLEVIALDLSSGLEKGYEFRDRYESGAPSRVHFVQADLQNPPLKKGLFDIIHSAGVLHHTPNTERTFRALTPLLKESGTFYVWLYKYEAVVTPIVNSLRAITTRIPQGLFAQIAQIGSVPFIGFCWLVDKLGIRKYEIPDRREAVIAVHDIFGAPYAHYHSFDEVVDWFHSEGMLEVWPCNDDRRGFGVCGR